MPADPSSFIPAALTQLAHAAPLGPAEGPQLLAYLATIADPRARSGRRHPLVAILVIAAAAVLTGARSMTAIAEWAADTPQPVRAALGARRDGPDRWVVPTETTIRRTLARLDARALAAVIGAWLADRDDRQVHLLAPMDHTTRTVLAQRESTAPPVKSPASSRCWPTSSWPVSWSRPTRCRPTPTRPSSRSPSSRRTICFMVKANQPTLLARSARPALASRPGPGLHARPRPRRVELRTLKAVTVNGFGFPHAAQVLQVSRKTRDLRTRRWWTVVVYAITSLAHAHASLARLADLIRGHWAIENGLHYVRDVTFAEDGSQVRTGSGPQVMACLRNLVIGVLSRAGPVNLAAALRHHSRDPHRPLATLGITIGCIEHYTRTPEPWSGCARPPSRPGARSATFPRPTPPPGPTRLSVP